MFKDDVFWDNYLELEDKDERKAKILFFKYNLYSYIKYLFTEFIPIVIITWFATIKLCELFL